MDGLDGVVLPSTSQPVAVVSISSGAPSSVRPAFAVGILPATVSSADSLTP